MKMPNTKRIVLNIPKLQLPRYICRIEMSFEHRYYSWGKTISHDLSSCKYSTRFSIIIKHCIHLRNQPREKKNIFHPWEEIFWHKYSSNKLKSYSIKFVQFYVLPCGSSFMLVWEKKKSILKAILKRNGFTSNWKLFRFKEFSNVINSCYGIIEHFQWNINCGQEGNNIFGKTRTTLTKRASS